MLQITSEEIVKAYIERCKEVNNLINAMVEPRFEQALEEARAIDDMIAKGEKTIEELEQQTPILGVPVTVKESISVQGMQNQAGRVHINKHTAKEDAPSVKQLRKNGGVIILVSNTPELCLNFETYNNVMGTTKNPYNLKRTPGGSSGGEAALLASGASIVSMSSDIAGSCRLPAMFCGIFGHKPTPYVVSPNGHVPGCDLPCWGDFFTIAPMTRYAVDLPLMLKCIKDPNGPQLTLDKQVDIRNIKYYFMDTDGDTGLVHALNPDMKTAFYNVVDYFKAQRVGKELSCMKWSLDISLVSLLSLNTVETIYYKTNNGETPKTMMEIIKYIFGQSVHQLTSVTIVLLLKVMEIIPMARKQKFERIKRRLVQQFKVNYQKKILNLINLYL